MHQTHAKGLIVLQMAISQAASSQRTHASRAQGRGRTHSVNRQVTTQYLHTQSATFALHVPACAWDLCMVDRFRQEETGRQNGSRSRGSTAKTSLRDAVGSSSRGEPIRGTAGGEVHSGSANAIWHGWTQVLLLGFPNTSRRSIHCWYIG